MFQRVATHIRAALAGSDSPERLACTVSLATYVAFCPFLGFHTLLIIVLGWISGLSITHMLIISNVINNPWTMVPVYACGYACGQWILGGLLGQDGLWFNPDWMNSFNAMLTSLLGLPHVSLLSFLIGGNVVGIVLGILVYPVARICIIRARMSRYVDCGLL